MFSEFHERPIFDPNFGIKWQLRTIWLTGIIDLRRYRFRNDREIWYIPSDGTNDWSGVYHSTYARGVSKRPYSGGNWKITRTWATERPSVLAAAALQFKSAELLGRREDYNTHL